MFDHFTRSLSSIKKYWNPFKQSFKTVASLFAIGVSLSLIVSACSGSAPSNTASTPAASTVASSSATGTISATTVRIGYQKAATILSSLKAKGILEKAFKESGSSVTWTEFPAGPPLLEALNAGSIDVGYTGELLGNNCGLD